MEKTLQTPATNAPTRMEKTVQTPWGEVKATVFDPADLMKFDELSIDDRIEMTLELIDSMLFGMDERIESTLERIESTLERIESKAPALAGRPCNSKKFAEGKLNHQCAETAPKKGTEDGPRRQPDQ